MKSLITLLLVACAAFGSTQEHDLKPVDALKNLSFLKGDWSGKQEFNTQGGPSMSGDATDRIDDAIGGHYLCEMLSTTLPSRKPTDTRHFISFDTKSGTYQAWWFTDTSPAPLEFTGSLEGKKLVLTSKPLANGAILVATYECPTDNKLTYTLEMQSNGQTTRLFTSTYSRKV